MQEGRAAKGQVRGAPSVGSARQRPAKGARVKQLSLAYPAGWGGRRRGAGRPSASTRRQVAHRSRPSHRAEHPVHVTLRCACRSLRTQFVFPTVRAAISAANRIAPDHFRVVHFSIQGDHAHLIVEARDRRSLVEGVRGLSIRLARRVNRLLGRRGRFFADRWHGRALESPRAVRNVLVYVLANFRKHRCDDGAWLDTYSSAPHFPGFIEFPDCAPIDRMTLIQPRAPALPEPATVPAKTWLLSVGWKRHGMISIRERPAT
jgi:putative transposase